MKWRTKKMTPKQRERALMRIEEIETKISEYKIEKTKLLKQLEDDDKQRLLFAVTRKGITIEDAIGIITSTATDDNADVATENVPQMAQNEKITPNSEREKNETKNTN
jgi:hypothetical protein